MRKRREVGRGKGRGGRRGRGTFTTKMMKTEWGKKEELIIAIIK